VDPVTILGRTIPRKTLIATLAVSTVIVVGGGIAFAYWSTTGSGTGTVGVGTNTAVVVTQDGSPGGLVPGGAAQPIDFTVTNPSATTPVQIRTVVIGFGSGFVAGCSAADFVLVQPSKPSVGTPLALAAGASLSFTSVGSATATAPTGATIAMVNSASNQDGCKSSSVPLSFTVS
jgi:hypothetical protein